jgi:hypothetical protein
VRPRPGFMLIVMPVVLAACSHAPPPTTVASRAFQVDESAPAAAPPARQVPPDVLIVATGDRVATIDLATGSVLFRGAGVPRPSDWSQLFATSPAASGATALRVLQPDTGDTVASLNLATWPSGPSRPMGNGWL